MAPAGVGNAPNVDTFRTRSSPSAVAALLVAMAYVSEVFSPHADLSAGTCWPVVSFVGSGLGVVGFVLAVRAPFKAWNTLTIIAGGLVLLTVLVSVSYLLMNGSGVCGSVAIDVPFRGN